MILSSISEKLDISYNEKINANINLSLIKTLKYYKTGILISYCYYIEFYYLVSI